MTLVDPTLIDGPVWQESWDLQQEAYLPDREHRFTTMLDTVAAVTGGAPPVVLDLAGGTGSISLRVLRRFPQATTVLVDVDPVLTTIARASIGTRGSVIVTDLRGHGWVDALPRRDFDAVLTATALHWFEPTRVADLYGEIRALLRPGGVFINADHMPDDGLPGLAGRMAQRERAHRQARWAAGAVLSWQGWWEHVAKDPVLGPLVPERDRIFANRHATEFYEPVSWHLSALHAAGYAEAGLVWRGASDAAVAGVH